MCEIGRKRWKRIGHTIKVLQKCIIKQALDWNPQGKRSRRRQCETKSGVMEDKMIRSGRKWTEVKKLAQDRDRSKRFLDDLHPETSCERL